jgi:DNA-binding Xre family transcriptional regulator
MYFSVEKEREGDGKSRPCALGTEEKKMANLYETIELLCQERGIRPGRLCADLGLSRGLMTDLKMGRKKGVNAETARKIADYLGVSVGYLLGQDASRDILDEVDVAFYGDFKELDEQEKNAVRDMVRIMRTRRQAEE